MWPAIMSARIELWHGETFAGASETSSLLNLLSAAERARTKRFTFARDRDLFAFAHAMLRDRLAAAAAVDPAELQFTQGPHGKPALAQPTWHFNLSHSGTRAIVALAQTSPVGIDLERINPTRDLRDLARRFFAPPEVEMLETLPPGLYPQGFTQIWTRKEAYIKATGLGLSQPLDQFVVPCPPETKGPVRLLSPGEPPAWKITALDLAPGYASAICASPWDSARRSPRWPNALPTFCSRETPFC